MAGRRYKLVNKKGRPTALRKNTSSTDPKRALMDLAMADISAKHSDEISMYPMPLFLYQTLCIFLRMKI